MSFLGSTEATLIVLDSVIASRWDLGVFFVASLRTSTDEVLRLDSVLDGYALFLILESGGSGGFGGSSFVVPMSCEPEFAFLSVMTEISGCFSITFFSVPILHTPKCWASNYPCFSYNLSSLISGNSFRNSSVLLVISKMMFYWKESAFFTQFFSFHINSKIIITISIK